MGIKSIVVSISIVVGYVLIALLFSLHAKLDNPLYRMKRIYEQISITTTTSPHAKTLLYSKLLSERFNDITYVYDNTLFDFVLLVNSRYSSTAGKLVESLKNTNDPGLTDSVRSQLEEHKKILLQFGLTFDNIHDHAKSFTDSANYIELYLKEL